jgi:hypothetical protein
MQRAKVVTWFEPQLDLLETRRQLLAMRSLHSHNPRVAIEINRLIGKIAHIRQPDDLTHEKLLDDMIAQTGRTVELILSAEAAVTLPDPESFAWERLTQPGRQRLSQTKRPPVGGLSADLSYR